MLDRRVIVTIDGPSGAGKSTISRMLAARLGFTYLDTGAMYRAVGLLLERKRVRLEDSESLRTQLADMDLRLEADGDRETRVLLNGEDVSLAIRTPEMGLEASRVSAHPMVRQKLTSIQQQLGEKGGIVAEGRDMGTVVFPRADFKFFLDASAGERARRRQQQLAEQGHHVALEEILEQIIKRDHADSGRALAPLAAAEDAIVVDSSHLSLEGVIDFMLACIGKGQKHAGKQGQGGENMTEETRSLKRRHLIYYLEVHDEQTGTLLGHLVDITTGGLKLVSRQPIPVNRDYKLAMTLPDGYFAQKKISFQARSLWSSNDINPDFYDTGFAAPALDLNAKDIILDLVEQLGFND